MVLDNSLDHLDQLGYEQIGPDSTLFEDGSALDLHQKYATPNRMNIELAHTLQRIDEERQKEAAEKREASPTAYEQMRRAGEWILYMRSDKINPIQPVTRQEIIRPVATQQTTVTPINSYRQPMVDNDHYNLPDAA